MRAKWAVKKRPFGRIFAFVVAITALLPGCSQKQMYNAATGVRIAQCDEIRDVEEKMRCREQAKLPHDQYQRQVKEGIGKKNSQ